MQSFQTFPAARIAAIRFVLTDIDDTLTDGPRLPAATYDALERLDSAGIRIIPVTAAPAGWCDLICRMWPVAAVIGENGGLCFRHDRESGSTLRRYWSPEPERHRDAIRLAALGERIRATLPQSEPAADQAYRETTLAFRNRDPEMSQRIAAALTQAGAHTVVNSLWVLGWLGDFDKLAMTRRTLAEFFATDIGNERDKCIYIGDSLNDEPMFGFFSNSVGVATVHRYVAQMTTPPQFVTAGGGGSGFVEIADALLGRGSQS